MKKHTSVHKIFALTVLALASLTTNALAQGSLTPPGAPAPTMKTLDQIESRTPISSLPITIWTGGSYYLTANLTGAPGSNGITIETSDVTLDLNGFSLIGVPSSKSGVLAYRPRVTIRNGSINQWGTNGLNAFSSAVVKSLIVSSNGATGIEAGRGSLVEDCVAEANRNHGIAVGNVGIVRNCLTTRNGDTGIYCYAVYGVPGEGATVVGCTASENLNGMTPSANGFVSQNNFINNRQVGVILNHQGTRVENNNFAFNNYGVSSSPNRTNLIIHNSFFGNSNAAVIGFSASTPIGPLISASGLATNTNPNANFSY